MDGSRVCAIREEVEVQKKRWNELMSGAAKPFAATVSTGVPVFRPHVAETDLMELLALVEENRKLKAELAQTREVKVYGRREQDR